MTSYFIHYYTQGTVACSFLKNLRGKPLLIIGKSKKCQKSESLTQPYHLTARRRNGDIPPTTAFRPTSCKRHAALSVLIFSETCASSATGWSDPRRIRAATATDVG